MLVEVSHKKVKTKTDWTIKFDVEQYNFVPISLLKVQQSKTR